MEPRLNHYFKTLINTLDCAEATNKEGVSIKMEDAVDWFLINAPEITKSSNKLMFVGNGGSAAIASHMAIDFSKNGNMPALAFNDGAALTCLGNDLGYEQVFAKQIELHAHKGDLLVAISSSGSSPNILNAVKSAQKRGCKVFTMSGFSDDNPLRRMGDVNLYVPSSEYGFVEISHLCLGHAILDIAMGWESKTNDDSIKKLNAIGI